MTDSPSEEEELQSIYDDYAREIPTKLDVIERLWERIVADGGDEDIQSLHRALHSMVGSGSTFGYSRLGEKARELELALEALTQPRMQERNAFRSLAPMLAMLRQAAKVADPPGFDVHIEPAWRYQGGAQSDSSLVYLLEDDAELTKLISHHLEQVGYSVRSFADQQHFLGAFSVKAPAAAVMDIVLPEGRLAGTTVAARLKADCAGRIPFIFISRRSDYEARASAARAGGSEYLTKPLDIDELVNALDRQLRATHSDPYRVLIVDDALPQAELLSHALKRAGMETSVASESTGVLQSLVDFNPDLIVMDLYLSGDSGDVLAKVIRQMSQYASLPIVFLSAETNLDRQLDALDFGGDEFLNKPIHPAQLIRVVSRRIARHRELQALITQDSLTGLSNHKQILGQLEIEVARARRRPAELSFAMIDIDYFKNVNDRHGHPMGDVVLKKLSSFLRQRLRQGDSVGRYGGEEFAAIFTETDALTAARIMDKLRGDFAAIGHNVQDGEIHVTFSCGISSLSSSLNAAGLVRVADKALYQAKSKGRNRVVVIAP